MQLRILDKVITLNGYPTNEEGHLITLTVDDAAQDFSEDGRYSVYYESDDPNSQIDKYEEIYVSALNNSKDKVLAAILSPRDFTTDGIETVTAKLTQLKQPEAVIGDPVTVKIFDNSRDSILEFESSSEELVEGETIIVQVNGYGNLDVPVDSEYTQGRASFSSGYTDPEYLKISGTQGGLKITYPEDDEYHKNREFYWSIKLTPYPNTSST